MLGKHALSLRNGLAGPEARTRSSWVRPTEGPIFLFFFLKKDDLDQPHHMGGAEPILTFVGKSQQMQVHVMHAIKEHMQELRMITWHKREMLLPLLVYWRG